jgi:mgtE-like transporter
MSQAGITKNFVGMFKETLLAFSFGIGGLIAGFMIFTQLGVFENNAPWAIALWPAVISAKGVINGLLSGRLGTALHLGIIKPQFFGNSKNFYSLMEALILLTLLTAVIIGFFSLFFGIAFWGVSLADYPAILSVLIATMGSGLIVTLITIKVAFVSFNKGLDPDIIVYPIMSTVADVFITLLYIGILSIFFSGSLGSWVVGLTVIFIILLSLMTIPRNFKNKDFLKTIRESLVTLFIIAFIVNVTGTFLRGIIEVIERGRGEIVTIYPALINMIGNVGSVVGSTATTKLALGFLAPSLGSIKNHARNIFSAWAASLVMFVILAVLSLILNATISFTSFLNLMLILLITNVIAVSLIVILSYLISISTFKHGWDPDNFVIPIESVLADSLTTMALFAALILVI